MGFGRAHPSTAVYGEGPWAFKEFSQTGLFSPASHPDGLDFMARDFPAHDLELGNRIRGMGNSRSCLLSNRFWGSTMKAARSASGGPDRLDAFSRFP